LPLQGLGDAFALAIVVLLGLPMQETTACFAAAVGRCRRRSVASWAMESQEEHIVLRP